MEAPLAAQVEQSIEKSLQNLGTAYIDSLVARHGPSPSTRPSASPVSAEVMHSPMPSLEENLEAEGLERGLGTSNIFETTVSGVACL